MDTSDVYAQVFQPLMPLVQIAIVLWAAETILTMLMKEHRKSKKKKEREKRRLEYQDRRMANDEEYAKVTRAMRYDVLRRDGFRCVKCGRGREDGVKLHVDHIKPVSRGGKSVMDNLQRSARTVIAGRATNTRSSVSDNKNRGRGTLPYPPSNYFQFSPLSILLIVNHRNAASADCIEMRAAEYLSVGL